MIWGTNVEKSAKILLIICVILIGGLCLSIGMIMGNVMNKPITLNTTNITPTVNTTVNQSETQTSTKKTVNKAITSSQAAAIALRYGKASEPDGDWSVGSVEFIPAANYENTANYMVELSNNGPVNSGIDRAMDVRINASNGAVFE